MTRREMLATFGAGFGSLGFRALGAATTGEAARQPHFAPKAKQVVFLFLNGGPSQVDTFDPKPALTKYNGQPLPGETLKTERRTGNAFGSPFEFKKYGQSGIEVSEIFAKTAAHIDDFCVIRSMHTERPNHEPSLFMMNCGTVLPGRPSMGAWLTYGLGSENQNLPGYMVLCPGVPIIGPQLWSSAFLPAEFAGVHLPNNEKDIEKLIPYIRNQRPLEEQHRQIELLAKLNKDDSGVKAMETAFRMQTEAPDVLDLKHAPEKDLQRYGDSNFGRGCLMARRLLEKGVRMVQVYFGNGQPWDNHDDILIHRKLANDADPAIAALMSDLKSSGMLKETIVIVSGEFGRTPTVETSGLVAVQFGRDHNNHGYSMLMAGGGIQGGIVHGATDDFGFKAIENPVHPHDVQATVLHQMGLDHTRLTYRYSGRDFRLTDVEGTVIKQILA
jgi:hypothetical protein